jgi:signal transduction histidine kinase
MDTEPVSSKDQRPVLEPGLPRNQRLERLLEISRSLSASLELEPFLHSLISAAAELTGCEAAFILELDESGDALRVLALPWSQQDALPGPVPYEIRDDIRDSGCYTGTGTTTKAVKVPLQTSMAGWVFQNGKPAVAPETHWDDALNAEAEPRAFRSTDEVTGFAIRSLLAPRETPSRCPSGNQDCLAVPIIYHGETVGVLEVVNKTEQAHYTEEDLNILEILASQAAIAIQNTRLLNKVQQSVDQMTQLERMKSEFIAIASHELRTPLGLILGHATFLRETIQPDSRPQLDIIVHNALRLKEIIDNLAKMDNVQRGVASVRARSFSIKRVVEEVMGSFQKEAEQKHLSMQSDTGQEDLLFEGDPSKIVIALSNMVKNAITFTNPDGHILIVAESIPGYIKVSVIDDGIGIPSKDLAHIFDRFYQVESHLTRMHGGMGLGLSIAKVMVEMHGGRIWAESVEGKGSNFTFLLPIHSGQGDADRQTNADR